MANIKSAKKRIKVTEVKTLRNTMIKSALKTKIKKFETAVVTGNVEEAKVTYANVVKALDMAVTKGILHINKAARRKSRLAAKLNALSLTA
jgi:small subunit ribosomal protein S20